MQICYLEGMKKYEILIQFFEVPKTIDMLCGDGKNKIFVVEKIVERREENDTEITIIIIFIIGVIKQ